MTSNFINIGLPVDANGFWELQKAHEEFMSQPHYTKYELNASQSGFLDARQNQYNSFFKDNKYYNALHRVYPALTNTQNIILDLYLCSGYSQAEITKIQRYNGSRSVLFHLEAISKKLNKLFTPQEIDLSPIQERNIVDPYTGRFENESITEWFNRMENGDEF